VAAGPLSSPGKALASEKPQALLEGFCPEPQPEEQLAVNSNGRLLFLRLGDVEWLEATDSGVALCAGGETYLLRAPFAAVAAKLAPGRFLRAGPSTLVNIAQFKE
jgi:DNA-binding LytR/AlgR family response regulator